MDGVWGVFLIPFCTIACAIRIEKFAVGSSYGRGGFSQHESLEIYGVVTIGACNGTWLSAIFFKNGS
jgi:hypothetical protein